jgi:hypothetical protein
MSEPIDSLPKERFRFKRISLGKKLSFWVVSGIAFLIFVTFLNTLDSGSYQLDSASYELSQKVDDTESIIAAVQLNSFDAASQTLKARIWISPPESYATYLGSSVQLNYDTSFDLSAAKADFGNQSSIGFWKADEFLRAIDVELDADNYLFDSRINDSWFPFDRYSTNLNGFISFRIKGSNTQSTQDDVWKSFPVKVVPYTASLSGWSSVFSWSSYKGQSVEETFNSASGFVTEISLERTNLNKALVFLIGFIFIGGGLSMLLLFRSILLSRRPPTLSGLIWSGSTAFTMIQTRTIIPGAPRVGVKFDLFIFYPSLVICFISGGLMFYHWVSKDTWSREL